ncbi:MAG: DUF4251 domain-containing protein [Ferruginibacter sp.]
MKTYKLFRAIIFLIAVIAVTAVTAQKQPGAKATAIKNAVDSQHYTFTAQYANPLRGGQRYLTSQYTIVVSKDKIICDLPFFGQSSSAPMPGSEGGIHFTTTNFVYTATPAKKGGWEVNIKLKDVNDVQQLSLSIFNNGTALVNVSNINRDPISFNGQVR